MLSETGILYSALAILALPLASYVITFLFGKKMPRQGDFIGLTFMGTALFLAVRIYLTFWQIDDPSHRFEWAVTWLDIGGLHLDAGVLVDGMTAVMLMVVCTVSFLVHLYSTGYMKGENRYERYFAFLGFFTFSMIGIVLSNNLFFLYVFWELVGLSSYLLIGFFFYKESAANANKKAFLVNRVGDYGFWLGILALFTATGTLNYFELFAKVDAGVIGGPLLMWAGLGLFMGCVGKSAQMPLHIWLPDAMEGPTPVSALIHAATMVAAGVYMVARLAPLFGADAMLVILYVGAITAFVTSTIALVKTDIKRVLAFSTLSQLGYMVMSLGAGDPINAMYHLTIHAMFKALLFLGAGSIIHAVHTQEMPEMGGLRHKMPITFWTFMAATLAISGVPFFAGFYSKDGILGSTLAFGQTSGHYLPFILGITAAAITPFYMFRVVFLTFFGKPRNQEKYDHAHESGWAMTVPLIVLGVLSIGAAGWKTADEGWFARFIEPYDVPAIAAEFQAQGADHLADHLVVASATAHESEPAAIGHGGSEHNGGPEYSGSEHAGSEHSGTHAAHIQAMIMSILFASFGIAFSWWVYYKGRVDTAAWQKKWPRAHTVLQGQYYFDEIYAATIYRFTLWLSWFLAAFDRIVIDGIVNGTGYLTRLVSWLTNTIDKYLVDGAVNGVGTLLQGAGEGFRRLQTGRLQTYLTYTAASVLVLILIYRVL